jgi:hypothetical protein
LRPLTHSIIADHPGDTQPVITKNPAAPAGLRFAMLLQRAPACDCSLVPEHRQREDFSGFAEAFEALDRNETINLFQQGPQAGGNVEIFLFAVRLGPHFENDRNHRRWFRQNAKRRMPPSTGITVP